MQTGQEVIRTLNDEEKYNHYVAQLTPLPSSPYLLSAQNKISEISPFS